VGEGIRSKMEGKCELHDEIIGVPAFSCDGAKPYWTIINLKALINSFEDDFISGGGNLDIDSMILPVRSFETSNVSPIIFSFEVLCS
jgi:hypothetical protein